MNNINKFVRQSSYYFISNLLIIIAGFASFPIWTRIFSKSEYGIFSLVNVSISLGIGFSKFGLQHSALRFFSDFKGKNPKDISSYYSTLFVSSIFISGIFTFLIYIFTKLFLYKKINFLFQQLIPFIAILIFIGSISSLMTIFIRADNKGALYSLISIMTRYVQLFFSIIVVFYFMKNVEGFFLGYMLSELAIFMFLLLLFIKKINIKRYSLPLFKESIKYGFPLIWMELANLFLNFGDRYVLQFYLGSEAVGIYSAGYNLSNMAQGFLTSPFRLAIIPMYFKVWNEEGEEETKKFLSKSLDYYFMVGIPIIIGMSCFGNEVITILASSKFEESAVIIPLIVTSLIIYGANIFFSASLRIYKKTNILMILSVFSAIVNILMNIILIPRYGIIGAAFSTFLAYVLLTILTIKFSFKYFRITFPIANCLRYCLFSLITVLFISTFFIKVDLMWLILKIASGITIYSIFIISSNNTIRSKIISQIQR